MPHTTLPTKLCCNLRPILFPAVTASFRALSVSNHNISLITAPPVQFVRDPVSTPLSWSDALDIQVLLSPIPTASVLQSVFSDFNLSFLPVPHISVSRLQYIERRNRPCRDRPEPATRGRCTSPVTSEDDSVALSEDELRASRSFVLARCRIASIAQEHLASLIVLTVAGMFRRRTSIINACRHSVRCVHLWSSACSLASAHKTRRHHLPKTYMPAMW